jgi:hypothetical protein
MVAEITERMFAAGKLKVESFVRQDFEPYFSSLVHAAGSRMPKVV